jgi:hypothetical protein
MNGVIDAKQEVGMTSKTKESSRIRNERKVFQSYQTSYEQCGKERRKEQIIHHIQFFHRYR